MWRPTIIDFAPENHLTDIEASMHRWKAPGMQPGRTCLSTSKDITIVSGCIPPSGISPPNRQSAKPLDPVSTKSGEGHGGDPSQTAGNRQLPAGSYEHRRDGVKIVSDGDSCCSHAMSVPDSSL